MTNVNVLSEVDIWVGIGIALVGSVVVAPGALGHYHRKTSNAVARVVYRARVQLARLFPSLRHNQVVMPFGANATVSAGTPTVIMEGRQAPQGATVEELLADLRDYITSVEKRLNDTIRRQLQESTDHEAALDDLRTKITVGFANLRHTLEQKDQETVEINARGLLLIAFGILLSGAPSDLARLPAAVAWALPAAGIAVAMWAIAGLARRSTPVE